jgi:hypothetical protein
VPVADFALAFLFACGFLIYLGEKAGAAYRKEILPDD